MAVEQMQCARKLSSRKYPQNVNASVADLECIHMYSQDGARSTDRVSYSTV